MSVAWAIDKPIWHGPRLEPMIALTFDDGPDLETTQKILSILDKYKAKATFFVVGKAIMNDKKAIQEIILEGHELANHTFNHRRLDQISAEEIETEISSLNQLVYQLTGKKMGYFRPPGGRYNYTVLKHISHLGMRMVLWDVNAGDYYSPIPKSQLSPYPYAIKKKQRTTQDILNRIYPRLQEGSIVLLHNTTGETIKILPLILETILRRGFRCVTLSTLLEK